jgi:hypothetical protein
LELVVEFEPIISSDYSDPISVPESSNPIMAEKIIYSRAREQRPSPVLIQNMDVDVDEDEDEEEEEEEEEEE